MTTMSPFPSLSLLYIFYFYIYLSALTRTRSVYIYNILRCRKRWRAAPRSYTCLPCPVECRQTCIYVCRWKGERKDVVIQLRVLLLYSSSTSSSVDVYIYISCTIDPATLSLSIYYCSRGLYYYYYHSSSTKIYFYILFYI